MTTAKQKAAAALRALARAVRSGVASVINLQAVIGLACLYFGLAAIFRPAVGVVVVGVLLVLEEVVGTFRAGKS